MDLIEAEDTLRVVVFDGAHPDFFLRRYDVSRAAETPVAPGRTGLPAFIDVTTRLAQPQGGPDSQHLKITFGAMMILPRRRSAG